MNEWLKAFGDFLDKVDARFKSFREEMRNEMKLEVREVLEGHIQKMMSVKALEPEASGVTGKDGRDGVDGKDGAPGAPGAAGRDGADAVGIESASIVDGVLVLRFTDGSTKNVGRVVGADGEKAADGRDGRDGKDGAPGRDGTKGDPGRDGKDGRDGITTEQLDAAIAKGVADTLAAIDFDGRTWKIGDRVVRTPAPEYKGVWSEGSEYSPGDMATYAGSLWHCNAASTEKPGEGSKAWTLAAKRGRDAAR